MNADVVVSADKKAINVCAEYATYELVLSQGDPLSSNRHVSGLQTHVKQPNYDCKE